MDQTEFRIDPYAENPFGLPVLPEGLSVTEASVLDLISTDVPGPYGYNPSPFEHVPGAGDDALHLDVASLFCRFSGTSGASAVIGGLIALAIQQHGTRDIAIPETAEPAVLTLTGLQPATNP